MTVKSSDLGVTQVDGSVAGRSGSCSFENLKDTGDVSKTIEID